MIISAFIIKFPSESRGLIILPVTGSRNGFGLLLPPVVVAFGEVVANV